MSSLAEVIVAGSLFLLAFLTMLGPLEQSHRSAVQSRLRLQALGLATDLVEELRSQPFQQLKSRHGDLPPYTYSLEVTSQPYLKVVTVTMRWGDTGRLRFGTYIQGQEP